MKHITEKQFINSSIWKFIEVMIQKGVAFIIALILARLLLPEYFGIVALTTVFITFSDVFIQNGFNVALVRKSETEPEDYSTVMALSLSFAVLLYTLFWFVAPYAAIYYNEELLSSVLRVIAIVILFKSITSVIRAKATREMKFKLMSISTIISNIIGGCIGLALAFMGCGIWALVAQQCIYNFMDFIIMIILMKWRFSFRFVRSKAIQLWKFSLGVIGAAFLDFFGNNISSLVIGKVYTTTELGYCNKGSSIPETISLTTYNVVNAVLLPTLASRQDSMEATKSVVRKLMAMTAYVIFPIMAGLIVTASRIVPFLLTDAWLPAVAIVQWASVTYAINPIRSINVSVMYAIGKSKENFRVEIIRCSLLILEVIFVLCVFHFSIYVFTACTVFVTLITALITQGIIKKYISYCLKDLLKDLLPSLLLTVSMCAVIYPIGFLKISPVAVLFMQIIAGIASYILLSILFHVKEFQMTLHVCNSLLVRKGKLC